MRKPGRGAQWKLNSPEAFALQGFPKDPVWMDPWLAPLRTAAGRGREEGRAYSLMGRGFISRGGTLDKGWGHRWPCARAKWGASEQSPPGKGGLIPFSGHRYPTYPSVMPGFP